MLALAVSYEMQCRFTAHVGARIRWFVTRGVRGASGGMKPL